MSIAFPIDVLEARAAEERLNLRRDVKHIRHTFEHKLNLKQNVREHLWPAAAVCGVIGIGLGYVLAAPFFPKR